MFNQPYRTLGAEGLGGAPADDLTEAPSETIDLPDDALIILPVRNVVMFPAMVTPLAIGRPGSVAAAQEATKSDRPLGILLQTDDEAEVPTPDDLYRMGTVANVLRYLTAPDGTHHVVCQGVHPEPLHALARTTSSARACSGSGCASSSRATRSWWRGSSASTSPRAR